MKALTHGQMKVLRDVAQHYLSCSTERDMTICPTLCVALDKLNEGITLYEASPRRRRENRDDDNATVSNAGGTASGHAADHARAVRR